MKIIAQLIEKRGETKQYIVIYSICAVLSLIASIVFFCLKDITAGVGLLCAFSLTLNNALSQMECYDYCNLLIKAFTLIDLMDKDDEDPTEETINETF